jgi:alpha-methylacyl-CoA racemase
MSGALHGVKIIEFAGLGPGPFCGMMLADHGAEVIRIDRIGAKGLIQPLQEEFTNRSRKTVEIDLKNPQGINLVRELCQSADAIFEGFRPGVMERLGLGPEILTSDNPRLVYGRMTGFGQTGPYAGMAGHDINYIALSGALHGSGRAGHAPTPPMNMIGDFGGGGMMLAFGILAAIIAARTTGEGQVIDCAMTDGSAVLMSMIYSMRAGGLWVDDRGVNMLDSGAHYYDAFETADGKYISLGPVEGHFYKEMIGLIGLGEDADLDVQGDAARWPAQKLKIAAAVRGKTRDEWCVILEDSDACFAPVMSLDEAPFHKHNVARNAFVDVAGTLQPAPAPRFSRTPADTPNPLTGGTHVVESILRGIGIGNIEIERMQRDGIVA